MSHYHVSRTVSFKDEQCLVDSLESLGYVVEVHAQKVPLMNWLGRDSGKSAHIIIRRQHIAHQNSAYNDVGFSKNSDGTFSLDTDFPKEREAAWVEKLSQKYNEKFLVRRFKAKGFAILQQKAENGKVQIKLVKTGR